MTAPADRRRHGQVPLDVNRMADAIHAKMCGPFTTIDPQRCIHGRQRDETLATILIAEYVRLSALSA